MTLSLQISHGLCCEKLHDYFYASVPAIAAAPGLCFQCWQSVCPTLVHMIPLEPFLGSFFCFVFLTDLVNGDLTQ